MPYRRSGRAFSRRGPRRTGEWVRMEYAGAGAQTSDACHDMLRGFDPASPLAPRALENASVPVGVTIARVRGYFAYEMGGRQIGNHVNFGLLVGHTEADNQNPVYADANGGNDWDWLWWERIPQGGYDPVTVETTATYLCVKYFDCRAKRKLNDLGDTLMLYWHASEPISEVRAVTSTYYLNPR